MIRQYVIRFIGTVQGVGFRYTCKQISKRFDIQGTVRNDEDGSVELICECSLETQRQFIRAVEESTHGYVEKTIVESKKATGRFQGFEIVA